MSEYMDYIADVNDVQDSVNDLALKMYEQGRADKERELSELPNEYSEKLWKIAYDRGYQQGRADQKEEDNAFFNFEGAWELEKKRVRADAFNEIMNEMTKSPFASDKVTFVKKYIEEQLKEQK